MMQIMFGACLRVSETIGLTWSDVDMKNREIHVEVSLFTMKVMKAIVSMILKPKRMRASERYR